MKPPSYEKSVACSGKETALSYRLYLQYKACNTVFENDFDEILLSSRNIRFGTLYVPASCIVPADVVPSKDIKDRDSSDVFTLVFELYDKTKLNQLLEVFTSRKYWEKVPETARRFLLAQTYEYDCIKEVKKNNDGTPNELVVTADSFSFELKCLIQLCGASTVETKYTLHVKFRKKDFIECDKLLDKKGEFSVEGFAMKPPILCMIMEGEKILTYRKTSNYTGPAAQFIIKGSCMEELTQIMNSYIEMKTPDCEMKCVRLATAIDLKSIESKRTEGDLDTIVVNPGTIHSFPIPEMKFFHKSGN